MKLTNFVSFAIAGAFVFSITLALFFFFSNTALAQITDDGVGGFVPCSGSTCNFCHFVTLGNSILTWLFGFVFVVFGILMVVAGIRLVTSGGNLSALDDAKKMLTNAIIGFLIMMAAWLIVDTLLKLVLGGPQGDATSGAIINIGNQSFGPWNEIECTGGQITPTERPPGSGGVTFVVDDNCRPNGDGTQTCETVSPTPIEGQECRFRVPSNDYICEEVRAMTQVGGGGGAPGERLTTAAAQQALQGAGISVSSSGGCTDSSNPSCTGLNFNQATMDVILNFQNQCGSSCDIVITGGTEVGHAGGNNPGTHGGGDKFDLRLTESVNNYITGSSFTSGPYTSVYGNTRNGYLNTSAGVFCVNEGDHWDCVRI